MAVYIHPWLSQVKEVRLTGPGSKDAGPNDGSRTVLWLAATAGLLAIVCGLAGFLWGGAGEPRQVVTLSGESVELYGRGLYRNDTVFAAGNNRGSDLTMLVLGVPLLVLSMVQYRRGSVRGRFLLLGTLGFFLYVGASYALGAVAYNEMFLGYVGLFAASLFALIVLYGTFDQNFLTRSIPPDMPRRWPGGFMVASGVATFVIWIMEPLAALASGKVPPSLETRTTLFTTALDVGVIVPAALVAGILILRGRRFGYVVAFSLLILEAMLLPMITIATIVQIREGVRFEPGEIVGPITGFSVFAVLSLGVILTLMRRMRFLGNH
jgi:hypothetical protein